MSPLPSSPPSETKAGDCNRCVAAAGVHFLLITPTSPVDAAAAGGEGTERERERVRVRNVNERQIRINVRDDYIS